MKKLKAKATRRTAKKARMEKKVNNTCKESNVGHTCKLCHFGMKVKPPKESNVRFKTRKTSLGSKMYFCSLWNLSIMQLWFVNLFSLWHLDKHCQVGVVLFKLGMLDAYNEEPGGIEKSLVKRLNYLVHPTRMRRAPTC